MSDHDILGVLSTPTLTIERLQCCAMEPLGDVDPSHKGLFQAGHLAHQKLKQPWVWPQDASGLRGASCLVAAGEEAALPAVPYQLGYAIRDVGVDFQVISPCKLPDVLAVQCFQRRQCQLPASAWQLDATHHATI